MFSKSYSNYEKKFTSLYNMFDMSLEEISKSYIKYKLESNISEYKQNMEIFNSIKAEIYTTKNDLSADAKLMNSKLMDLNGKITKLNIDNTKLSNRSNTFDDQGLAAEGELKDQKFLYNELYTQNIILIIIIFGNIGFYIINNYKS